MALWQGKSKRKKTGGRFRPHRGKRKTEIGREQQTTVIGKESNKKVRTRGGNYKFRTLTTSRVNVYNPKSNKTESASIKTVIENPANPNYVRRNILTKGAIIDTDLGKARLTSRPGQHGIINAILI